MNSKIWAPIIVLLLLCTACNIGSSANTPTSLDPTATLTETPLPTPTATPLLVRVNATVWTEAPLVPVIAYHQFKPDGISPSDASGHKIQLGDLRDSLQKLYDGGFSLISLADWLSGDLSVPAGRRPLVLSMDDLFFTNQLLLDDDGQPSPETGIGVIWQFAQEHPDFGFHLSLFAVLGDKYYPFDPQYASQPNHLGKDWEQEFGKTIVWCLENDVLVFNHTYKHGYLSNVDNPVTMDEFIHQLQENDERMRELLNLVDRSDLIPLLGNVIALPGGAPPRSDKDWETLQDYKNPEGQPVQAILGIASAATDPAKLEYLTSPYDPAFDKYRIPRIVANMNYTGYLADHAADFPAAQSCSLLLNESYTQNDNYLSEQINDAAENGTCPAGLFVVDGKAFDARSSPVSRLGLP